MSPEKNKESDRNLSKLVTPVLVVLLIGASFMGGSLFTQLKSLEKKDESAVPEETAAEGSQEETAQETSPKAQEEKAGEEVLGEQDQVAIEDSEIVKGPAQAPVTIVEFSEYQCPYCKRYVDEAYVQLWAEYEGQIRYIFRDYPLPFHQNAQITAEAARCAGEQADYWGYHDLLFKDRTWETAEDINSLLADFADQLGLDTNQFSSCLSSGQYTQAVKDDLELGKKVGVGGTPSFFINGRLLVGAQPFSAFKTIIDEELAK